MDRWPDLDETEDSEPTRLSTLITVGVDVPDGLGVMMNNGNGTNTVFGSNGTITTLPTP